MEQVGWGVARQVVRVLREQGADAPLLDLLPDLAEQARHLAYAVFRGRTASAVAAVHLDGGRPGNALLLGAVVVPDAEPGTHRAILVRALHDAAGAGVEWLEPPAGWSTSGFEVEPDRPG